MPAVTLTRSVIGYPSPSSAAYVTATNYGAHYLDFDSSGPNLAAVPPMVKNMATKIAAANKGLNFAWTHSAAIKKVVRMKM